MALRDFRELVAWQRGFALCLSAYRLTRGFPDDERYGLVSQLRRASVSIPSNIAEGYCRASRRECLRFLGIARGSLAEVQTQLLLANELACGDAVQRAAVLADLGDVQRLLTGLIRSLETPR